MDRFASVEQLKGVGEKSKKMLEKLEIYTIDDLLTYYPRTYRKFEDCTSTEKLKEGRDSGSLCSGSQTVDSTVCEANADYDSMSVRWQR